jgi:O-antigen/teichoic acid export membrane protein
LFGDNLKKNKAFSGILTIGVGNVAGGAITSLFWLFLAGILGTETYGQLSYFLAIMGITSVAASFGGPFTMQVYVSKGLKIEAALYFISIITSLIGAIILFFMFEDIGLSLLVITTSVLNLYLVELLGKKLFSKHSKIYIFQKLLFVTLSLLFFSVIGFEGILIGFALSNFVFSKHVVNILRKEKINFNIIKEKKKIIFSNYLSNLVSTTRNHIDELLTVPLFGLSLLGNYFLALQIIGLMYILPSLVVKYTLTEDSRGNSTLKVKGITILSSIIVSILGALILPELLPIFLPEFTETVLLIPILCFAPIPRAITLMLMSSFLAKEKNFHIPIGHLISIGIMVIGIFISFQLSSEIGIAYSYVLGISGSAIYLSIISWRKKILKI